GVRQVEVEVGGQGARMEETLRSIMAVRPEAIVLSQVPDRATAVLLTQLASSVLVVAEVPSQTAAQAVTAMMELGVPPQLLSTSLAAITCQRLRRPHPPHLPPH